MFKGMMSSILFVGLMVVSATSNATILVNHHNQPYEGYVRVNAHQKHVSKKSYKRSHQRIQHRSYSQHSKVVDHCLRMNDGRHHRVC